MIMPSIARKPFNTPVLTVKQVSEYLKINPSTVYRLLKAGRIPAFRVGSDWRFNREEIDLWLADLAKKQFMT